METKSKHGGKREGAGRKTKYAEKTKTISFSVPPDLVELIAKEVEKSGMTKSEWIVRKLSQNPEL